jgi:very-short-patch-repair endonuclease
MTNTYRRIVAVATGQLGLLSRRQANGVGMTNAQLRSRVESGSLVQVGTDTFRLPGAPSTPLAELRTLLLDVGGDVWASGPTAAALHGFDGYRLRAPFDVMILRGRDVQRIGHRIHTTTRLDIIDRSAVAGVPVLSGARTLIDLARREPIDRLAASYESGLRDGRFNAELLHRRIVALRSSGRHGIPRLLEAIESAEGAHSWLEREYVRLLRGAGLPLPRLQQVVTSARGQLVRVDFEFPGTPVVVEVLGYRYHRTKEQLGRDTARMNALLAEGRLPYQFTYDDIVRGPDAVIADTRAALARCR